MGAPSNELEGKVAIVTGGARGMGTEHVRTLALAGASVLLCDIRDAEGEDAAAALQREGLQVSYYSLDVTDDTAWAGALAHATGHFGGVDVLVNNAGIASVATVEEETLETWRAVLAVNATGSFLGIRAVAPAMRIRQGGAIVNIASVFGLRGAPQYAAYCASKGAVLGMTRAAALALVRDEIRVNAICPGSVETEMTRGGPSRVADRTPFARRARFEEMSAGVLYLASERSSYLTGTELVIDGGFLVG
jgi:NAD(P)-dependent dehydrogenase (short-subunit alcohol dehydrogenase family)